MNSLNLGLICGLVFGVVDVLIMIPMKVDDKRKKIEAMAAAFIERFATGFLIPNVVLGLPPAWTGGLVGLVLSLPSAIIARAYAPIIGVGVLGGLIIGLIAGSVL
jgi:hypothetical protein